MYLFNFTSNAKFQMLFGVMVTIIFYSLLIHAVPVIFTNLTEYCSKYFKLVFQEKTRETVYCELFLGSAYSDNEKEFWTEDLVSELTDYRIPTIC